MKELEREKRESLLLAWLSGGEVSLPLLQLPLCNRKERAGDGCLVGGVTLSRSESTRRHRIMPLRRAAAAASGWQAASAV